MSAGEVAQSFCGGQFIFETEDEGGGDSESWSEKEQSHGVTVVWDGVSPGDDFIEAVEEDSEEAEDDNMESSDSAGKSHVSNKHRECAYDGISHSVLSSVGTVQSVVISMKADQIIRSIAQCSVVVVIS